MATIPELFALALKSHQAGDLSGAGALYAQILEKDPNHADAWHLLGLCAHQTGKHERAVELLRAAIDRQSANALYYCNLGTVQRALGKREDAIASYRQALALEPAYSEAHNFLGVAFMEQGRWDEALGSFQQALRHAPNDALAHNNLGNLFQARGTLDQAAASYREALRCQPDFALAHNNLGSVLKDQDKPDEAISSYRQALKIQPDFAEAHYNLGNMFSRRKDWTEAVACYRQALALKPDMPEAHNSLGCALRDAGTPDEAATCFQEALRQKPDYAEALGNLGAVLVEQGKLADAIVCYEQALRLKPDLAALHNNLGNVFKEQGRLDEAIATYRRALSLNPELTDAWRNLGGVLAEQGNTAEALDCLDRERLLAPSDGLTIRRAFVAPIIVSSTEEIARQRARLQGEIARLLREPVAVADPVSAIGCTSFYLAYHGLDDRELQRSMATLFAKATPSLAFVAPHCLANVGQAPSLTNRPSGWKSDQQDVGRASSPTNSMSGWKPDLQRKTNSMSGWKPDLQGKSQPLKIGFISKYFYNHSIGKFYAGVIRNLARAHFHVTVFRVPGLVDWMSRFVEESADVYVTLPPRLESARQAIAEHRLDVLFYTDIGMDPLTYFLAFARLAPLQCAGMGHPVTTGIPTIDTFISDVDLEPANAGAHYTEQLIRLQQFPFYYCARRPATPPRTRRDFGLDLDAHLYVCAQSLFKIHPEFDRILGAILRADSKAKIALFQGTQPRWTELLTERLRRAIPGEANRVLFLPQQSTEDFLHLLAGADVLLDTIHFSGGVTTFESFLVGTPIVTLPGSFMRGRQTYACYRKMGLLDLVAANEEDYVRIAVRLGTDPAWRNALRSRILAANHVLYDNTAGVRELERFFIERMERE